MNKLPNISKMLNVFISQPMAGKTDEEIKQIRKEIKEKLIKLYPDNEIWILDSYIHEDPTSQNPALYMLGKSLEILSEADIVYFAKGWNKARGCFTEHLAAQKYGVEIVYETKL